MSHLVVVAIVDDGGAGSTGNNRGVGHVARPPHLATILCRQCLASTHRAAEDVCRASGPRI